MARVRVPGVAAVVVGIVVVVVLVGVFLARPGGPAAPPPDRAERQSAALASVLGRTPGSRSVDVGAGRDLRGNPYVATVVTLDPSATADQVAQTVAQLPGAARRAGLPDTYGYRQLAFLTGAGARLTVGWEPSVDEAAVRRAAAGWLSAAAALTGPEDSADVAAIVLTRGDIDYRISLGATPADGLLDAYDRAAAGVDADTSVLWELTGTDGPTALTLSSRGPIDAARRQQWQTLLADTDRLGGSLAVSRLDVSLASRVQVHLTFLAPDSVDDADVTPAAYGRRVWPVVRPQLTSLAASTDHWSYFLSWAHQSRPDSEQLIALLFGDQGSVRDGTRKDRSPFASAGWAPAARAYLSRHRG